MATTYTLISSTTLGSNQATVTFSSIPSTYTDLIITGSTRINDNSYNPIYLTINSNTGSVYSFTRIRGNGSAVASARVAASSPSLASYGSYSDAAVATANTFSSFEIYIPNYTAAQNKQIGWFGVTEDNTTTGFTVAAAILYQNTTSISSLSLTDSGGFNFVSGSSFYLYGIKNS